MRNSSVAVIAAFLLLTSGAVAQEPATEAQKPAPKPPAATRPESVGLPVNVKLDLTITDQAGPGDVGKRTVSMIIADRRMGVIRSSGRVVLANNAVNVTLNVDAEPYILNDNQIRLTLALEYAPKPGNENATSGEGRAHLTERLTLWVQPGKPMVISQASDPTSDRKITAELVATVLK